MSTSVSAPQPSEEEKALQAEQAGLLREQRDILSSQYQQQQALLPLLYEEAGVTPQLDESGAITGFTREPDPAEALRKEVELGLLERSKAALAGELPVSPTLEREISQREETLNESLRKQLGTGYATSTPGREALTRFGQSAIELREGARRGELTLAEQLGVARGGFNQATTAGNISTIGGVNQMPLASVGAGTGLASGFGQAVGGFQQNRALQLQAQIANAQANATTLGGLFSGLGFAGGMFLGA